MPSESLADEGSKKGKAGSFKFLSGFQIGGSRLITLVRMKKYFIHPADLHLVFNLVNSSMI